MINQIVYHKSWIWRHLLEAAIHRGSGMDIFNVT